MISSLSGSLCHPCWDLARGEAGRRLCWGKEGSPVGSRPCLAGEDQEGHTGAEKATMIVCKTECQGPGDMVLNSSSALSHAG